MITITVPELVNALRLGSTLEETAEAERLLAVASAAVERFMGDAFADAPDAIVGEAAIRLCGYWFDQPNAGRGTAFSDAMRSSGALQILAGWRIHRAGSTAEGSASAATGTNGNNPVVGVSVVGDDLLISFLDGTIATEALPPDDDDDETARAAAAAAQATADAAGLRLVGTEAVSVAVADEWVATALPYPETTIFGVKVNGAPIELGLTVDLPTVGVVAGGDASGAIGSHLYALGAVAAGGVIHFASNKAGTFTVRVYQHG